VDGANLLAAISLSIALLLLLILRFKVHAVFALLAAAVLLGVGAGMPPAEILTSLRKGMGDLLGSIALLVAGGMILGRMIEISGGGQEVARFLISAFGQDRIPWAIMTAGYIIAIPVFFDAGFLTLIPLMWSMSKETKKSLLTFALPLLCGLTATHGLVPPSAGPAAAAELLGADMGKVILYGMLLAIPMSVSGGIVYAKWISRRMFIEPPRHLAVAVPREAEQTRRTPSFGTVLAVILFPVLLISMGTAAPSVFPEDSKILPWILLFGSSQIALVISAAVSIVVLGLRSGLKADTLLTQVGESLNAIGSLIIIIGTAGSFKQVIVDSGAGPYFAQFLVGAHISPLLIAFCIGAALRLIIGSATASILTAGGLAAPVAAAFPHVDPALMVMGVAIGGSITSHVNDAGFWMVKEYCGMTVPQTLKAYSVAKVVTSLTGLAALLLLSLFV